MDKLGALSRHEYLLLLAAFVHFEASYAANAGISHRCACEMRCHPERPGKLKCTEIRAQSPCMGRLGSWPPDSAVRRPERGSLNIHQV